MLALAPAAAAAAALGGGIVLASFLGPKWLALAVLAYLAAAAGAVFPDKRLFAVWLVAACIPVGFQYNLWTHGSKFTFINHFGGALAEPVVHLWDLPLLLLLGVWIVDLRLGARELPPWTRTDTLIAALLAFSLPSLYVTEEYLLFAFELLRYLKFLALYWILRTYLDRPAYFWGILAVNAALLVPQGMVSMLQYFLFFQFPIPVGGVAGVDAEMVGNELIQRVTGVLGHSNTFSAYLSLACTMALTLVFARIRTWARLAAIPLLAAGLMALVLTFSRNGWMIFALDAVIVCAWAARTGRLSAPALLGLAGLAGLMIAGLLVSGVLDTMMTRVFRTDGKAFDSRWDLIGVAWEMIKAHPFTGIGLNSFEEAMGHYDPNHITHVIRQPVHNAFLLVAAETGLPALACMLALAWGHLRASAALLGKDGELHFAVGLAGLAAFGGLGAANLFDVTLRKESVAGMVVVVAAMVASLRRLDLAAGGNGIGAGMKHVRPPGTAGKKPTWIRSDAVG